MDLEDIQQILALLREHDLSELEIEKDGLKVKVRKASGDPPVVSVVPSPAAPPVAVAPLAAQPESAEATALADEVAGVDLSVVTSPIVGTFYRSSEPDARPFVDVGDKVSKGQVICIIEAMKLMNEIESECDGEIAAVHVENGAAVQFGDRLFAIKVS
jgi:acetyl-CoA carboxylase biotin carboxyl carrier protein